jgi:capsid portal protein
MATKRSKKKKDDEDTSTVRTKMLKTEADSNELLRKLINPKADSNQKVETPPLSPKKLSAMFEVSSALRPNIDAYITNIDSRGHRFKPAVDLNSPDAVDIVKNALFVESLISAKDSKSPLSEAKEPTDAEVQERIDLLRRTALLELSTVRSFFSSCVADSSFIELRRKTRQDLEATGNAYWEVLRGKNEKPRNLNFLASRDLRLGKMCDAGNVEIPVRVWKSVTEITWEPIKVNRTFKRFAKVDDSEQPVLWFKEYGDPRTMSRDTGDYFMNVADMLEKEGKNAKAATELLHFDIHSPASDYGVPRWAGNIPAVLGSRELDETNLDYFMSNAVPALALLVTGGRFGANVENRLREFFTEEVRGRRATHKLIILEAEGQKQRAGTTGPTPTPRIEFVPLRNAQVQDALFQKYDDRNIKKIGVSFRIPESLTGGGKFTVSDLRFAEEQVYQPERDSFDSRINKTLMPELSRFWAFESKATVARDPEVIGRLATQAADVGIIVPAEARKILEQVFGVDLPVIRAVWAAQPIPFTMAALGVAAGPAEAVREQGRQDGTASPMNQLLASLGLGPETSAVVGPPAEQIAEETPTEEEGEEKPQNGLMGALSKLPGLGTPSEEGDDKR